MDLNPSDIRIIREFVRLGCEEQAIHTLFSNYRLTYNEATQTVKKISDYYMKCNTCGKKFHYCDSCGYDFYANRGFCDYDCWINSADGQQIKSEFLYHISFIPNDKRTEFLDYFSAFTGDLEYRMYDWVKEANELPKNFQEI